MNMKEKLDKLVDEIEVDDEMVLAAAKDINETLNPNPLLDLEKPGEELQKDVEELFPNLISGDALSDMTWNILKALGWKSANQEQATNKKGDQPVKEKTKMETNAGEFAMAAADIQKSLAVNPPLDLNVGEEALKEELVSLLPNIQEGDDLAVTTWATLKKLGWSAKSQKIEKQVVNKEEKKKTNKTNKKSKKYAEDCKIKILVKDNPKKSGSESHARFEFYKKAKTVGDFLKLGGLRADLSWDSKHKFIEIK